MVHPLSPRVLAALLWTSAAALACLPACRRGVAAPPPEAKSAPASRGAPPSSPERNRAGYGWTQAEQSAVDDFLRRHPDLRVAADGDRQGSSDADADMRSLYGVYHPYFVRGDLNDDGVLDFVLAFVRRDSNGSAPWFTVVVFEGRGAGRSPAFSEGTFIERDVSIARGDLSVDRDSIVITPDLDDEAVRRYRWNAGTRSYVFVRDSDDETEPPTVSRTSGSHPPPTPRARSPVVAF